MSQEQLKPSQQEVELDMTTTYLKSADKNVKETEIELKVSENQKKEIIKIIEEVQELEEKNVAYRYYLEAVKRDGVPYQLISKALPAIENEVNNILSQLVDFTMTFDMDGKNLNNYIVYDNDNNPTGTVKFKPNPGKLIIFRSYHCMYGSHKGTRITASFPKFSYCFCMIFSFCS